jgi:hypothetical protein
MSTGLDPVSSTPTERQIRWPTWTNSQNREGRAGRVGASPTSSRRAPFASCWTRESPSPPQPVTSTCRLPRCRPGSTKRGRTAPRQDRPHHRRARGSVAAVQAGARAHDGARPKRSGGSLRQAPSVRFALIDARRAEYPITVLCRALGVSRAGYYASVGRPPSARAVEDRRLAILIRESHERGRRFYGSPRVHLDLARRHRVFVSRKRVVRIMQREGLKARIRKRFKCTTMSDHDRPSRPTASPGSSRRTGRTSQAHTRSLFGSWPDKSWRDCGDRGPS